MKVHSWVISENRPTMENKVFSLMKSPRMLFSGKYSLITMWTTSGGHKVDVGGRGQPQKQCTGSFVQAPYCSSGLQMCGQNYLPWPVINSLSSLVHTYLNIGPFPLHSPRVHSHDEWTQDFPISCCSLLLCIILNANWRTKNGKGLTKRLWKNFPNLLPVTHAAHP